MPSYEERLVQMESVLKNSVTNNYYGEQGQAPRYVWNAFRYPITDNYPGPPLRRS
jgi:hypothetical protein